MSETFDDRFIDTGIQISEYDLQKESGVLAVIQELPMGKEYLESVLDEKQSNIYKLWIRPTIPWKLECEGIAATRADIMQILSVTDTTGSDV